MRPIPQPRPATALAIRRKLTAFAPLGLALLLAGCGTAAVAIVDEKVSKWTASDCSANRFFTGGPYCREAPVEPGPQPALYCYRTLGTVDCYSQPDPWGYDGNERVVRPPELQVPPPT